VEGNLEQWNFSKCIFVCTINTRFDDDIFYTSETLKAAGMQDSCISQLLRVQVEFKELTEDNLYEIVTAEWERVLKNREPCDITNNDINRVIAKQYNPDVGWSSAFPLHSYLFKLYRKKTRPARLPTRI
jgi:hypothetical protein